MKWIEIVAPLVGAWIEISQCTELLRELQCRSSCRSVD